MWYSSEVNDPPEGCGEALSQEANRSQTIFGFEYEASSARVPFGQLPITQKPATFCPRCKNTSNLPKISDGNFGCQKGAVYRGGSLATGSKRILRLII